MSVEIPESHEFFSFGGDEPLTETQHATGGKSKKVRKSKKMRKSKKVRGTRRSSRRRSGRRLPRRLRKSKKVRISNRKKQGIFRLFGYL